MFFTFRYKNSEKKREHAKFKRRNSLRGFPPCVNDNSDTPDEMSKVTGGCGGKSKGGKSRSKGVGSDVAAVRTVKLSTSANGDVVSTLRRALRNDDGTDRDLLNDLPAGLRALKRSGLDLVIEFHSGKKLNRADAKVCLAICREELQEEYEVSGYGWDEEDKWGELTSSESRLLLFREAVGRRIVGYASFRLTLQGECWNCMEGSPCLFVYDLLVLPEYRRKGVGKQALLTLEMAARKARLAYVCALVTSASALGPPFLSAIKGWRDDTAAVLQMDAADPDDDSFRVYAKCVDTSILQAEQQSQSVQAYARQLAAQLAAASAAPPPPLPEPASEARAAAEDPTLAAEEASDEVAGSPPPAAEPADKAKSKNAKKKARQRAARKAEAPATPPAPTAGEAEALSAAPTAERKEPTEGADGADGVAPPFAFGRALPPPALRFDLSALARPLEGGAREEGGEGGGGEEGGEGGGEEEEEVDRVLDELCALFEERNGRPATESEIASWVRTIKEANLSGQDLGADPAAEPADGGLCGETGEAGCVA